MQTIYFKWIEKKEIFLHVFTFGKTDNVVNYTLNQSDLYKYIFHLCLP